MRTYILISIFFVCTSTILAQEFNAGFSVGISPSQIDGDAQQGFDKFGLKTGFYVSRSISSKWTSTIEMNYIGKGAVKQDAWNLQVFKTQLHYIQVPVYVSYNLYKDFEISLGIAPAYLIDEKLQEYGLVVDATAYSFNVYDIPWHLSIRYPISKQLLIELSNEYSLSSIRKDHVWLNNTIVLEIKYAFK